MSETVAQNMVIRPHLDMQFNASAGQDRANFNALMAALADLQAGFRKQGWMLSELSERVAILESRDQ